MASIWSMGELLVEIMRPRVGIELWETDTFRGPFPSGAPPIFIDAVARLGHPAGLIGAVGADDFGRCIVERLEADGVDCANVQAFADGSTAVAFVTYFEDGSRKFIYHIGNTPAARGELIDTDAVVDPAYFHLMGCSIMTNDAFRARIFDAMNYFHAQGAAITFDPNIRPELLGDRALEDVVGPVLDLCTILLPGVAELELIAGQGSIDRNVAHLFATRPVEIIVLKRGAKGCTVYTADERIDIPAFHVEEVDPTGAGDFFDAGFLCGLLEGKDLRECGQMAAAAGALNAAAFGPMEGDISQETVAALIAQGGGVTG